MVIISHTILSKARSISEWPVFAGGGPYKYPLAVRTRIVAVPGRLPLCHQLFMLLMLQPFA